MATYKSWFALGVFAAMQMRQGFAAEQTKSKEMPLSSLSRLSADFSRPCANPVGADTGITPTGKTVVAPKKDPSFPLTQPEYPLASRQVNEAGTVMLNIYVTEQGLISRARVVRSSGWQRLDEAAVQHARNWRLIPGSMDNKAVCMWVTVPVIFDRRSYSTARLEATSIKPEAESLARLLFGGDAIAERLTLQTSGIDGSPEDVRARLFEAVVQQEEWHTALRDLAAMLSIEFSSDELAELNNVLRSPVARKFLAVQGKMRPEITLRQQHIQILRSCIRGQMNRSTSLSEAGPDANNIMPARFLNALPRLVTELSPYCNCVAELVHKVSDESQTKKSCGLPPNVTW